jgi:hypothetical protein
MTSTPLPDACRVPQARVPRAGAARLASSSTRRTAALLAAALGAVLQATPAGAQPAAGAVPEPSQLLGLAVGADRTLADWPQITRYFAALAAASPRVRVDTLGPTTQNRPMILATITSPENMRRLDAIRRDQARLADPRGLSAADEARLVAEQPAVVMISCNIHANEIGSSQMAMELAHRLATNDTLQRALERVVVLLVPSMNPDGQQMITDWYKRGLGTPLEGGPLPYLYHHYVGHDNNRDWYMVTQKETRLVTDVLYRRWFPEVFYDVHQQGNEGMRLTLSPYVDPIDPNIDPLIVRAINHVGAEMALALEARGKSGVGDGATYDLWWHGGARSTPYRHNMVGLLSEAASVRIATPITQSLADLKGHPRGLPKYERRVNYPNPWPGGTWRLRDIIDYELIASETLVRMLAEQRADYVRNFVRLGRKSVRQGEAGGPFAYVIPAGQRDAHAVQRLVEVLRAGAVEVSRATAPFAAGGRRYAAGSYVVPMAQPYRAHAKDLLEPQRFPKQEQYPGGPEVPPYDVAGWTLPYQLGVQADAVDSAFVVSAAPRAATETAAAGRRTRRGGDRERRVDGVGPHAELVGERPAGHVVGRHLGPAGVLLLLREALRLEQILGVRAVRLRHRHHVRAGRVAPPAGRERRRRAPHLHGARAEHLDQALHRRAGRAARRDHVRERPAVSPEPHLLRPELHEVAHVVAALLGEHAHERLARDQLVVHDVAQPPRPARPRVREVHAAARTSAARAGAP